MLKHPNTSLSHQPLTPFNWRPFDLYNNIDIEKSGVFGHLFGQPNSTGLYKTNFSNLPNQSKCLCCCYCCGVQPKFDQKQQLNRMNEATDRTFVANYRKLESPANKNNGQHVRSRSVTDSCSDSDKCHCCNSAIRNLVQLYFQSRDNKFTANNDRFNQFDCIYTDNLCSYKDQMSAESKQQQHQHQMYANNVNDCNRSKYHRHYRSNSCENVSDIDINDKLMAILPKRANKSTPLENHLQWPKRK